MRILLAVNFDVEARLIEGIVRSGHDIVDRVTGAEALANAVAQTRPELVIAQAGPETLNRHSLGACDAAGTRTIGVVVGETERRHAHALGLIDRITGEQGWDAVVELLERRTPAMHSSTLQQSAHLTSASGHDAATATTMPPSPHKPSEPETQLRRRDRRRRESNAAEYAPPPPHLSPRGTIISVWGPHGAPGTSTIAMAIAGALTNSGTRVLLIDADSYGGSISLGLGITDDAPGLAAACRLAAAGSLNTDELNRVSSTVGCAKGTLRVLTGASNPARWPEFTADRMRQVLEFARTEFEVVVVDTGFNLERDEELVSDIAVPRRNAATHAALEAANTVVAVGEATPTGMQRYLRARVALGSLLNDVGHVETVINRLRRSVTGADTVGQVRQVLLRFGGIEHATLLPDDSRAADRALAEAIPITDAAPRSQLVKQLCALATRLHQPTL